MASSQRRHGLQLPAALAQELGIPPRYDEGSSRSGFLGARGRGRGRGRGGARCGGAPMGRKEARKAARQAKKQHRHEHNHEGNRASSQLDPKGAADRHSAGSAPGEGQVPKRLQGLKVIGKDKRKKPVSSAHGDGGSEIEEEALPKKKARVQGGPRSKVQGKDAEVPSLKSKEKTTTPLQRLLEKTGGDSTSRSDEDVHQRRKRHLSKAEQDEEDEIAWLEYKLGKKGKKAKKSGEDDGLGDLLDDLDRFYPGMYDDPHSAVAESEGQTEPSTLSQSEPDSEESSREATPPPSPPKSKPISKDTKTPLQRLLEKTSGGTSVPETGDVDGPRRRKRDMSKAEQDEEDEIAWLEHKLGKKGRREGDDDGLNDLLDDLDRFYPGMYDSEPNRPVPSESEEGDSDADSFYGFESQGEMGSASDNEDEASPSDAGGNSSTSKPDTPPPVSKPPPAFMPAPTSMPASASDTPNGGKYVPPALRKLQAAKEAEQATEPVSAYDDPANVHLRRQLKGQLNRLGEGNLDGILTTLEGIFTSHSRAVVTQILTRLLIDAVVYAARATDQFIVLNAALISALHRTIGIEFGASFVADLVDQLVSAHGAAQTAHAEAMQKVQQEGRASATASGGLDGGDALAADPETMQVVDPLQEENSKKALNLVSLLCELYNLQTVSCLLVYDLIRHFAQPDPSPSAGLSELSVELLLRTARLCGAQLRSDDPSSLRDIVDYVQEKAVPTAQSKTTSMGLSIPQQAPAPVLSSRSKFMLERLADLRSGRAQRQGGAGTSDTVARMKKYIGGLGKKRSLRTHDAIRVTLKDLQDADRKGRWWLVGAAWTGHDGDAGEGVTAARPLTSRRPEQDDEMDDEESQKHKALVGYARAHGLGTSVRQGIFVTIMTSADFVDAASRLQGLRLNEVQRREIVRVLVRCMQIDAAYNPYFALIGFQLAGPHVGDPARAVRFTMQYALWDFMRATLGQTGVAGKSHAEPEEGGLEGDEDVDEKRIANVARSYAWWIAKGALTLNVLKTVDFVSLRPKARFFIQHLLADTLLSTQTRSPSLSEATMGEPDRAALERVVVQGTVGNVELTRGLLLFTKSHLGPRDQKRIAGDTVLGQRLQWALGVARETLQVGASLGGTQ